jgi:hypothetical protein
MEHALPLRLSDVGDLVKEADEVEYKRQTDIDLYDRDAKTEHRRGTAVVTSHRVAWIDKVGNAHKHWHLSQIAYGGVATEEGTIFVGSAKIKLFVVPPPRLVDTAAKQPIPGVFIKLSFKIGGRDEFRDVLIKSLEKRSWLSLPVSRPVPTIKAEDARYSHAVGISGVLKHAHAQQTESKALATQAFSDLGELEKHAKKLVGLAEAYAKEIKKRADAVGGSPLSGSGEEVGFASLVHSLGIVDPVTREAAGSQYLPGVAKQLASLFR